MSDNDYYNDLINTDNDINNDSAKPPDNLTDGTEDTNHNGRIEGDNGDGIYGKSETWTETSPNLQDSDSDSFSDKDEKDWGYNPLSTDSDGDGISDDNEDIDGDGEQDPTEPSAKKSDTDGDGLSDKMEIDGWTVIIIKEATLEIDEEREVSSNPLTTDADGDGINDCGEFGNGTDPNDDDTDGDGIGDKDEIDFDYGSSPTGIDGQPPIITDFDASYKLRTEVSGPWHDVKITSKYIVVIKIGASDIFGLDWINVHLEGVGNEKKYFGGETEVFNKKFEFTLDVGQATKSLFKSFEVNVTAEDENANIGFTEDKVPSISEILLESLIGVLFSLINMLDVFINILEGLFEIIKNIAFESINYFIDRIDINIILSLIDDIKFGDDNTIKNIIDPIIKWSNFIIKYYKKLVNMFGKLLNIDYNGLIEDYKNDYCSDADSNYNYLFFGTNMENIDQKVDDFGLFVKELFQEQEGLKGIRDPAERESGGFKGSDLYEGWDSYHNSIWPYIIATIGTIISAIGAYLSSGWLLIWFVVQFLMQLVCNGIGEKCYSALQTSYGEDARNNLQNGVSICFWISFIVGLIPPNPLSVFMGLVSLDK